MKNVELTIKEQAEKLAADNHLSDASIRKIYWFPNDTEIRLVELTEEVTPMQDDTLYPFYFRPSPSDDLFATSAIALIRPEEFGKLKLPADWGTWANAIELPLVSQQRKESSQ